MNYSALRCLRDNIRILLLGGIALLALFGVFVVICAQPPVQWEPTQGVWFCDELSIQLSYEEDDESFIIEDGNKIICACGSDRGSRRIEVSCQDNSTRDYYMGELVFSAEILSLEGNELNVYHKETEREYIFLKVR